LGGIKESLFRFSHEFGRPEEIILKPPRPSKVGRKSRYFENISFKIQMQKIIYLTLSGLENITFFCPWAAPRA
jgi:hypothetical protein